MKLLCAHCGAEGTDALECPACAKPPLLDGRYRLLEAVGRGAIGTTYRAETDAGEVVAVKEMLVRASSVLEQRERFEREADVLQSLDHPGVPAYIDHFDVHEGKIWHLYLVQSFVEGASLEAERKRRRYTEAEVCALLAEVAEVLAHLHGLRPPVVHRDLKPANVMRTRDDRLVLIDFGSVKGALDDPTLGGSTVAGTFGYMSPEQLVGKAEPRSDLYALGAMAAVLLTGRDAVDLAEPDRLRWRPHTAVSDGLGGLVDELLARDPGDRPSAESAARRLRALSRGEPDPEARAPIVREGALDLRVPVPPPPRSVALRDLKGVAAAAFTIPFGLLFGGIGSTVGLVFMGVGFFGDAPAPFGLIGAGVTLVFGGLGFGLAFSGFRKIARRRRLLRHGRAVEGVVTAAQRNTHVRINGVNPMVLRYRYFDGDVEKAGHESRLDDTLPVDLEDARVMVLIDPDDPTRTALLLG